jgi:GGDEF domain-containing protein
MASVNLTCTVCSAAAPCDRCAAVAKALRAAGHSITQSSRYDALRAAAVGTYGFDACVLPVARHEPAVIDAASALFGRTRVALVVEPGAPGPGELPEAFTVIEAADWHGLAFPTDWIASTVATTPETDDDTRVLAELSVPATDVDLARRRLKGVARRVQRELGAAGFPEDAKLDLLATLEDEIAWAKMSGVCFGLVLVHVAKKDGPSQAARVDRLLGSLRRQVSGVVRASDIVTQGSDSVAVIVAEAAADQTAVATSRIKKAVRRAFKDAAVRGEASSAVGRVTLGTAVYPTHGTTRAALLARAAAAATQV